MTHFKLNPSSPHVVTPFYTEGKPFYCLTNFSGFPITDPESGVTFPTTEHYFQACKIWGNPLYSHRKDLQKKYLDEILACKTARQALECAQRWTEGKADIAAWEAAENDSWHGSKSKKARKIEMMERALRMKMAQQPGIRTALASTGNSCLVEDTATSKPVENEWGWGDQGEGRNLLGLAWMHLRNELHAHMGNRHLMVDPEDLYRKVQAERRALGQQKRDLDGYGIPVAGPSAGKGHSSGPTSGPTSATGTTKAAALTPTAATNPFSGLMEGFKNIGNSVGDLSSGSKEAVSFSNFFKILFGMLAELCKPFLGALGFKFDNANNGSVPGASGVHGASNPEGRHDGHSPVASTGKRRASRFTGASGTSGHTAVHDSAHPKGMGFSHGGKRAGLGDRARDKRVRFEDDVTRRFKPHRDHSAPTAASAASFDSAESTLDADRSSVRL